MAERQPAGARPYQPSALPSVAARALAVAAIVVGGVCGALIGWAVADVSCGGSSTPPPITSTDRGTATEANQGCGTESGLGALIGGVAGASGVAVIAVLVLRAMAEWRGQLPVSAVPMDEEDGRPQGRRRTERKPSA